MKNANAKMRAVLSSTEVWIARGGISKSSQISSRIVQTKHSLDPGTVDE